MVNSNVPQRCTLVLPHRGVARWVTVEPSSPEVVNRPNASLAEAGNAAGVVSGVGWIMCRSLLAASRQLWLTVVD